MARSPVEICNLALARIGISMFISALDEASNEASVMNMVYGPTLERLLSEMPWNFATRYAELQDIGTPPGSWLYRFQYPNDCLRIRRIYAETPSDILREPYLVVEDRTNGGLAVCANIQSPTAEYTARITNVALFTPIFTNALIWALAAEAATPLSANAELAKSSNVAYQSVLHDAFAAVMNEQQPLSPPDSEFIRERA